MSIVCFGEIMLRLSPPGGRLLEQADQFEAFYGGSEANVAVSLARLGLNSAYVTRVPDNPLGRTALSSLAQHGVNTRHCLLGGERLGIYFLEPGAGRRSAQVVYDRSGSAMATIAPDAIDWDQVLTGARWFHWSGITPALSASCAGALRAALEAAARCGIGVSCDLNYREKLWQYGVAPAECMPDLIAQSQVVLGDENAFKVYFGIQEADKLSVLEQVAERFPHLTHIAMSARRGTSAARQTLTGYIFHRRQLWESEPIELPDILDRIGSGDAFMAGLLYGLLKPFDTLAETLSFATAAAALKHYIPGDANLGTEQEIRALMHGDSGVGVRR